MRKTRAVLIVGGSGFVGSHLALRLRENYKVFATFTHSPIRIPGVTALPYNAFDRDWIKRVAFQISPDVIFYVAGTNDVIWCENNAREAERIHTGGAASVLTSGEILQPKFIYLSNSNVFDGKRGNYRETDVVLPGTNLGKAKVGGENFIKGRAINYVIVRASPLIGFGMGVRPSFLDRLRRNLEDRKRVELPADELHSFAEIHAFSDFMARLVETGPKNSIVHYGGLTKVSYYELARAFARRFGYDANLVVPHHAQPHGEPKSDYSLNSSYAARNLKVQPLLLEESFDLLEKHLVPRA